MLKLILADNQAIFRAGIAKVLAVEDEMRIVAQAQTQEQMFMALDKFRAAVRIVALIVQGYKNKEIATQLGTTEQVIKNYLRNVYDKIGVSDRLELALFTIHHRILNEAAAATAAASQPQQSAGVTS